MLMVTEPKGNLEMVRLATSPAEIVREQQRYPYKAWYAVRVRPSREQDAADGFRRRDVLAYWPNYEKQMPMGRHAGARRHRVIFAPIFPGLIFCPTADHELFWLAVSQITFVVGMFKKTGGEPATLTNADIERIRRIEAEQNEPPAIKPLHNFKTGQKVRFSDNLESQWPPGKIERVANDGRISVLVYLMGRMVPVSVLPHQIEAMS
jgi:transcription antitermination factor NusG